MVLFARGKPQRPRTYIGLYLDATYHHRTEEAKQSLPKLDEGPAGWDPEMASVVEAACDIGVSRLFPTRPAASAVSDFIGTFAGRAGAADPLEILTHPNLEAIVWHSIDSASPVDDLSEQRRHILRGVVAGRCTVALGLDAAAITQFVIDAEDMAFQRGYRPPRVV